MLGRKPVFEADGRRECEAHPREGSIGKRMPHITLLRAIDGNERLAAGNAADDVEHLVNRDARPASNIVYTSGNASGGGRNGRADRVSHEREVSRLFAITVQRNWLAAQRRPQKAVETHVGPLPGAIYSEVSERHGRHAMIGEIQIAKLLG